MFDVFVDVHQVMQPDETLCCYFRTIRLPFAPTIGLEIDHLALRPLRVVQVTWSTANEQFDCRLCPLAPPTLKATELGQGWTRCDDLAPPTSDTNAEF
jgi:hypothetical protein